MSTKAFFGMTLLGLPLGLMAEGGISLGPDTKLHLTADSEVRLDDNVTLTRDKQDDTVFIFAPGIDLNYNGGLSKAQLTAEEQFYWYADHSSLDSQLFKSIGDYSYEGALTQIKARARYQEFGQGSLMIRNREEAVRHDEIAGVIDGLWSATAKTRLGFGAFYSETNYQSSLFVDRYCYGAPLDVYYSVTPKVDLSVGYRYRRSLVDKPVGATAATPSEDSTDHFFNVGARGEFTPKLKGQVRVGYGLRDFDDRDAQSQFALSGAVSYVYSPKTSFDLSVSNDFSNSALGYSQRVFSVRSGARFEFTPQWSMQAGLSYEVTKYATTPSRRDDFLTGDIGVVYTFSESVSAYASYVHRTNWSTIENYDIDGNVLTLGLSLRY